MTDSSDQERFSRTIGLLRAARDGNSSAMSQIVEKYEAKVLSRIRSLMGPNLRSFAESGDCAQDVFMTIVKTIGNYPIETEEDFLRWSTHIARNRLRDLARRQRVRRMEALSSRIVEGNQGGGQSTPGPATMAARKDDVASILDVLSSLPENYRRVIELRILDQLTYEDIATELGQSRPETVRVLFSRAMARLTRLLSAGEKSIGT